MLGLVLGILNSMVYFGTEAGQQAFHLTAHNIAECVALAAESPTLS